MRNFASTLVKFSKLSHIQTTILRPPKMAPPPHCGVSGGLCYATGSKSSYGIIGQTRKQEYAAEWALIYHEVLSITNTFREITNSDKGGNTETANASSHHHLSPRNIQEINARTDSISSYISSQGNPFCKENHDKVKNLVSCYASLCRRQCCQDPL